jgi:ATP-dependent Lhr-like helicase
MITVKKKKNPKAELDNILHPIVREWFYSRFSEYSLPQRCGVMEVHSRNNVLISAPTGATKTLTSFLSILNELVDSSEKGILEDKVYCVYVSPLKALNYDIQVNLLEPLSQMEEIAGRKLGIRVGVRTGDTTPSERAKMLKKPPHILITTPESLAIILTAKKFREKLDGVSWLIVDEIHALADNKRGVYLSITMERLQRLSPGLCRIGLSATVAPLEDVAKYLAGFEGKKLRPCRLVDVQFIKDMDLKVLSPVSNLISSSYEERNQKMYELLHNLIQGHKTTLIFTNTRAATERVIDNLKLLYPSKYGENIGAHHGSLSKELRHRIETRLRKGQMRVVVSSTSLELGIDIGFIDLVVLLGSPKSVARALQRTGRSGHKLHDTTKGRIVVLDRDDLVECAMLLKDGIERKIDRIHIPRNALDVLAQQVYGMVICERFKLTELFSLIRQSYCFHDLDIMEFNDTIRYLSGEYASLEDRRVYAKIYYDQETGMLSRRGKLARVHYMTNIGTIPDESFVTVKVGSEPIGKIDEGFLEKLRRGDIFVLGGEKYEFLYSRGMTAFVNASVQRPPNIPRWVSEMLPLSFDLASDISRFRRLMCEKFESKRSRKEIIGFIHDFVYVDKNAAESIYEYFFEQYHFSEIPHDRKLLVEHYKADTRNHYIFHSLYGRRTNDALSRAFAYTASRVHLRDIDVNINDNGFYLASDSPLNIKKIFEVVKTSELDEVLKLAIEGSEVLLRRFRHCATRSLMIFRNYLGRVKRVGRQQVSSRQLYSAVKRISNDFPILAEARREVLEDVMDIENAKAVVDMIREGMVSVEFLDTKVPSPFAFNLIASSYTDIIKIEDKVEFLKNMHKQVILKIALKKDLDKRKLKDQFREFNYQEYWESEGRTD